MQDSTRRLALLKEYLSNLKHDEGKGQLAANVELRTVESDPNHSKAGEGNAELGLGLFATKDIRQGECIFVEPRLLTSRGDSQSFFRLLDLARALLEEKQNRIFLQALAADRPLSPVDQTALQLLNVSPEVREAFRAVWTKCV